MIALEPRDKKINKNRNEKVRPRSEARADFSYSSLTHILGIGRPTTKNIVSYGDAHLVVHLVTGVNGIHHHTRNLVLTNHESVELPALDMHVSPRTEETDLALERSKLVKLRGLDGLDRCLPDLGKRKTGERERLRT